MRPIKLDMAGFASFREPASIDFTDADFFALVGPTGSGKSTVIDAMTFALYGSVPRWGRKGMVSLALAPTVARGTVKLVFEAGQARYVIARELRRTASQVSQRAASLERLLDPAGLAEPGDPTTPMAKDLAGVTEAVERLLGLSYEDFVQCVVLPQGQFADFLRAKPADRQEILLRLLGAEHYKKMMMRANQRAGDAKQRADTLAETLLAYADATPEAEQRARAAAAALQQLRERVTAALPQVAESQRNLAAAEADLTRLGGEQQALAAVRVPAGTSDLDTRLTASTETLNSREQAERAAEEDDKAAREALAAGPQRGPLDRARERRDERDQRAGQLPGLHETATHAAARAADAADAVQHGENALEQLRTRREEAAKAAETAAAQQGQLASEVAALTAVSVPPGVAALDDRAVEAARAAERASSELKQAEQADDAARAALDAAAPEGQLASITRDLNELRSSQADQAAAQAAEEQASATREAAHDALSAALDLWRQRREESEAARRANVIAGLRPHLIAGDACPLCTQAVTTLPPPVPAPEADHAQQLLTQAEAAVTAAREAAASVDAAVTKAGAALEAAARRRDRVTDSLTAVLDGPLAGVPLPAARSAAQGHPPAGDDLIATALAEVAALTRQRDGLQAAASAAAAAVTTARNAEREAQQRARQADGDRNDAQRGLRAARDPLVALGAPQTDEVNLARGWAQLAQWAGEQAAARSAALAGARTEAAAAAGRRSAADTAFTAADRELARLRDAAQRATREEQQAQAKHAQVAGRITELDDLLEGAPGPEEVTAQLTLLGQLEQRAASAGKSLQAARAARAGAQRDLSALQDAESNARRGLSRARDAVVALGAPYVDGQRLLEAWTQLAGWAAEEALARQAGINAAGDQAEAARVSVSRLTSQLSADLAESGISLAPGAVASGAAAAVEGAAARAQAEIRRITERREAAAALTEKQQAAQQEEQVANMLGGLLKANRFPRWLVTEAVDDLVAVASGTLGELSGGQFSLAHDDGEFFVIDHADADNSRSVRTLSGGETFQASLALALALSSQISALGSAGAGRLDSIFLDEGFGTLDTETLDVVAGTLETLAQTDRMVGVVTHVTALAERVPVRFRVTRNPRTSTVTREGLSAGEQEVLA